jgi:hypothetical protein
MRADVVVMLLTVLSRGALGGLMATVVKYVLPVPSSDRPLLLIALTATV